MTKIIRIDVVPVGDDFEFRVSPVSAAGARLAPFLTVQSKELVLDNPVAVADDIEIRVGEAAAVVDPASLPIT